MSTSGLVHAGLGWPSKGPEDDDDSAGDLGWPTSPPEVEAPAPEPSVKPATIPQGDGDDSLETVSRETAIGRISPPAGSASVPRTTDVSSVSRVASVESVSRAVSRATDIGSVSRETDTPSAAASWAGDATVPRETGAAPVQGETGAVLIANISSERDQLAASLPEPGAETPLAQAVAADARRRISLTGKVFPKPDHTRILTVANQKGGVGKTTTTVNVAAALAQAGLKVLVIDIDPQGNASTALGIDHHAEVPSIYDVLLDGKAVTEVVQECVDVPNLWCIPATIDLAGAEIELVSVVARETRMQRALSAYIADMADRGEERLDYVLIDCPPSLGLLTVNAFVAADEVLIPIQCEYYALEGLSQLLKNVELIKSHLNPVLHVSTILLTMYDGRTRLSAQVADEVRSHFPDHVLRATVPRSVRISEAPSHGQTVMTYDPGSSGALSYLEAASELADRGLSG